MNLRVLSKQMELYPYQQLYFTTLAYGKLHPLFTAGNAVSLKEIEKDKHILLVTGIASQQNSFKIYHHTMSTLSHWLSVTTMTLQQEIWN